MALPNRIIAETSILNCAEMSKSIAPISDDFTGGTSAGESGWTSASSGTGVGGTSGSATIVDGNHPGVLVVSCGTDTNGRYCLHRATNQILVGGGPIVMETLVNIPNLSDVTDEYDLEIGFGDQTGSSAQTNGIFFSYDRNTSANWYATSVYSSSSTAADTSIVVGTGWTKFRIEINAAASSVEFFTAAGGSTPATRATVTTKIPTTNRITPYYRIIKSAGTTARTFGIDYWTLRQFFTTAR